MNNNRSTGRFWHRDWSAVAAARAVRWRRGALPGLSTIARRASQPTLRLFGAGRKPGPSMATVLPRTLPLVLRMKRPQQIVGRPMLTVQSEKSIQLSALGEEDRTPVEPAAGADAGPAIQAQNSPVPPAGDFVARSEAREPESTRPSVAGRVSRAVQQILRRQAPPAAQPPATSEAQAIARNEPPAASNARGVESPIVSSPREEPPVVLSPREEPPAANASSRLPFETSTAPSSEAEAAPEQESYTWQAGDHGPMSVTPGFEVDFESSEEVTEADGPQRPASPVPGGVGGMLLSLRRVLRHEAGAAADEVPPMADAAPARPVSSGEGEAPTSARVSQSIESPAPTVAGAAPTLARSAAPAETSSPAVTEAPRRVESARSEPAPPLTRAGAVSEGEAVEAVEVQRTPAAEPRGESRGLLFTLRRLVRPERVSETTATAASSAPASAEAASIVQQGPPAVQAESVSLAREIPVKTDSPALPDFSDDAVPASEFEAEASRPAPGEELTYLRPQSAARLSEGEAPRTVEAGQSGPAEVMRSEAAVADSDANAAPVRSSAGGSRFPRLLPLWRRSEEPRAGLDLTLARQATQPSPAAEPVSVTRSTGDSAASLPGSAGVMRQGDTGFEPDAAATNRSEASPAVLRRPARGSASPAQPRPTRASASPATPRPTPSLVYLTSRAASPAEAVLPGMAGGDGGAMRTLQAGPAAIARRKDNPFVEGGESAAAGEAEVSPGSVGPAADVTMPPAEEGAKSQVNLETLARQVYDRLRQRLQVDRERAGIGSGMIGR